VEAQVGGLSFVRRDIVTLAVAPRVVLALLTVGSFVIRAFAVVFHPTPLYMPDEYLYATLSRSLAAGHLPVVRGQVIHFPALLAPLASAPFQALFSPELAYRLTQVENALFMSLAAVPVYFIARRVRLSSGYSLACAGFAVAIPDLLYASFTSADAIAYPLVLSAFAVGLSALERPRVRAQLGFLILAGLAVFARAQYLVLPAVFLAAAVVVDGRDVVRRQRVPLGVLGALVVFGIAAGPSRFLGVYTSTSHLRVGAGLTSWLGIDAFLLACSAGVVIVPGAVVGLLSARGRTESAFSAMACSLMVCLVGQAALFSSNGLDRFQERYLFVVLPLIPVAFCLYLKNGRPWVNIVTALAVGLFLSAARLPVSAYSAADGKSDSPFLIGITELERLVGEGNASLLIALATSVLALAAVAVARGWGARTAIGAALLSLTISSVGAVVGDAAYSHRERMAVVAPNPSWIDAAVHQPVTLVQTPWVPVGPSLQQLYWNKAITREVTLGHTQPTDTYAATAVATPAADGTLTGVQRSFVFQSYGVTAQFSNAKLVARNKTFLLFKASSTPRLALLELGRYHDGWLGSSGRLTVWQTPTSPLSAIHFQLSLPPLSRTVHLRFGRQSYTVNSGAPTGVVLRLSGQRPASFVFTTDRVHALADLRTVSVLSTEPLLRHASKQPLHH
jgi:hypothetical protein